MANPEQLTIRCPDCGAEMKVDAETGHVLSHRPASKKGAAKDFDSLLAGLDDAKERADEVFRQEVAALDQRDRLMEEKFRQALDRAKKEDDGKPPVRPWDLE